MTFINYASREINCRIIYGPGLCGKTTNLQHIYDEQCGSRRRPALLATETDRTLFFDFLPLELGTVRGFKTRFHLYTVPGQVFYDASRKLILKGVDGVIIVADSQEERMDANIEALDNLVTNLKSQGYDLEEHHPLRAPVQQARPPHRHAGRGDEEAPVPPERTDRRGLRGQGHRGVRDPARGGQGRAAGTEQGSIGERSHPWFRRGALPGRASARCARRPRPPGRRGRWRPARRAASPAPEGPPARRARFRAPTRMRASVPPMPKKAIWNTRTVWALRAMWICRSM